MKILYLILPLVVISLNSCKPKSISIESTKGEAMHEQIIRTGFQSYTLDSSDVKWNLNGLSGSNHSSCTQSDTFVVKEISKKEAIKIIEGTVEKYSKELEFGPYSRGPQGDDIYSMSIMEESGSREYFMDYVLFQKGNDVEVHLLYKGIAW